MFRNPPVNQKTVPKAGYECMNVHWKKSTNDIKGKPELKYDVAFETIFRISKWFQRSKQKFHINFFLELGRLKI
jgi:hypothetical protein